MSSQGKFPAFCKHHHAKLKRAIKPKPAIIAPEILFTHCRPRESNFSRNTSTLLHNISIQDDEPMKTPTTKAPADRKSPPVLARPKPANIATKERIVIGFVSVRKNVEAYAPARQFSWSKQLVSQALLAEFLHPNNKEITHQ